MRKLICSAAVGCIILAATTSFALENSSVAGGAVSAGTFDSAAVTTTNPSWWTLGFYTTAGHAQASAGAQTAASFSADATGNLYAETNGVANADNGDATAYALNIENAFVNLGESSFAGSAVSGDMSAHADAYGDDAPSFLGIGPDFATASVEVIGVANQNSSTFADANAQTGASAGQGQTVNLLVDKDKTDYGFFSSDAAVCVSVSNEFELQGSSQSFARQTNDYAGVASATQSTFTSNPVGSNNETTIVGVGAVAGQAVLGAGVAVYAADYEFTNDITQNASGNASGFALVTTNGNGMTSTASSSSEASQSN